MDNLQKLEMNMIQGMNMPYLSPGPIPCEGVTSSKKISLWYDVPWLWTAPSGNDALYAAAKLVEDPPI